VVPRLVHTMAIRKDARAALLAVLGEPLEELMRQWTLHLQRQYWPEIGRREVAGEIGKNLTNHAKTGHYLNRDPAFSPTGDRIAVLSDRDDHASVYILSAIDGKVLSRAAVGEKSGRFEEMHWLRGGISWSSDGTQLVFTAKTENQDALYIIDVKSGDVARRLRPDEFSSLYSPDWSPDGSKMVFVAVHNGRSDLYSWDLSQELPQQLTDDLYDEADPAWSPDGLSIAFASDRQTGLNGTHVVPLGYDRNIFVMSVADGSVAQLTSHEADDTGPAWSPDGEQIVFSSDRNGIYNLYSMGVDSQGSVKPMTDLLSGAFAPGWSPDGRKLAFTAFVDGGWDVIAIKDPMGHGDHGDQLAPAEHLARRDIAPADTLSPALSGMDSLLFRQPPDIASTDETLQHRQRYQPIFSADLVNGLLFFDSISGLGAQAAMLISDVMGDHQIYLYLNVYQTIEDADFELDYYYLKPRVDFGIRLFQYRQLFVTSLTRTPYASDRIFGSQFSMSYPFSKFARFDLSTELSGRERVTYLDFFNRLDDQHSTIRILKPSLSLINDTVVWGRTGPTNGSRSLVSIEHAPKIDYNTFAFTTLNTDYRYYRKLSLGYYLAFRWATGGSIGRDPIQFLLGGTRYWINFEYDRGVRQDDARLGISEFVAPLRGAAYGELRGSKFSLVNLEFRYPLVHYLNWGWPIPLTLHNVAGVVFMDAGTVWGGGRDFRLFTPGQRLRLNYDPDDPFGPQALAGYGFGARLNLGIAVLRWDVAWPTDFVRVYGDSKHYWSLGAEF